MNNWELKAIGSLIVVALIAVLVAYLQMNDFFSGNGPLIAGSILICIGGIPFLVSGLVLLIAAFQQSPLIGWLFLLLPFYSVYFVIDKYEGFFLGLLRLGWIGGGSVTSVGILLICLNYLI